MKKKTQLIIAILMIALVTLPLFAGGGKEEAGKKEIVIGKIPITMEHGYHQGHVKHLINYMKEEYGVTVNVIDGEFSSEKAMSAVETFVAQGVDGILLHSVDEKVIALPTDELAHKLNITFDTAEEIQRAMSKELENLLLNEEEENK